MLIGGTVPHSPNRGRRRLRVRGMCLAVRAVWTLCNIDGAAARGGGVGGGGVGGVGGGSQT